MPACKKAADQVKLPPKVSRPEFLAHAGTFRTDRRPVSAGERPTFMRILIGVILWVGVFAVLGAVMVIGP